MSVSSPLVLFTIRPSSATCLHERSRGTCTYQTTHTVATMLVCVWRMCSSRRLGLCFGPDDSEQVKTKHKMTHQRLGGSSAAGAGADAAADEDGATPPNGAFLPLSIPVPNAAAVGDCCLLLARDFCCLPVGNGCSRLSLTGEEDTGT